MDNALVIPSVLRAMLLDPELRAEILLVAPTAKVVWDRLERDGPRHPNGMVTETYHELVRRLNNYVPELRDFCIKTGSERMESLGREYHDDVLAIRQESHARLVAKLKEKEASGELPGFIQQARNLARATVQEATAIVGGKRKVSAAVHAARLEICRNCPRLYSKEGAPPKKDRCRECGCYVETKTSWRSQSCPLGKWEKITR